METEGLLVCGKCRDLLKMHGLIMNKICRTSPKTEVYHVSWLFGAVRFLQMTTLRVSPCLGLSGRPINRISSPFGMMLDPNYYHPYVLRW